MFHDYAVDSLRVQRYKLGGGISGKTLNALLHKQLGNTVKKIRCPHCASNDVRLAYLNQGSEDASYIIRVEGTRIEREYDD